MGCLPSLTQTPYINQSISSSTMDSPPRRPPLIPRRKELFNISEFLLVTLTYTWNQYIVFLMGSTKISHRLVEKPTTLLTALPNTVGRASKKALQAIRAASEPN
jgi:hypothetical protein